LAAHKPSASGAEIGNAMTKNQTQRERERDRERERERERKRDILKREKDR
jgi:hypothetical protein